jgi:type III secretion system chaperone SycN
MFVEETLRDFGRSLGISGLGLNPHGVVNLKFEARGTLYIEPAEETVFIYMSRETFNPDKEMLSRALSLCHYREALPFPVHTALGGDQQLIFLLTVSARDFSLPVLEKAIDLLTRLHRKVSEGF